MYKEEIEDDIYRERFTETEDSNAEQEWTLDTQALPLSPLSDHEPTTHFTTSSPSSPHNAVNDIPSEQKRQSQIPRYFLPEDHISRTKLCLFCRKPGHVVRHCTEKEISCTLCQTTHDPLRCPASELCYNCNRLGHQKRDCVERSVRRVCSYCDTYEHSIMQCDHVWRNYVIEEEPMRHVRIKVSCYYCAKEGHFGDACPKKPHFSRKVSAFNPDAVRMIQARVNKQMAGKKTPEDRKRIALLKQNESGSSQKYDTASSKHSFDYPKSKHEQHRSTPELKTKSEMSKIPDTSSRSKVQKVPALNKKADALNKTPFVPTNRISYDSYSSSTGPKRY